MSYPYPIYSHSNGVPAYAAGSGYGHDRPRGNPIAPPPPRVSSHRKPSGSAYAASDRYRGPPAMRSNQHPRMRGSGYPPRTPPAQQQPLPRIQASRQSYGFVGDAIDGERNMSLQKAGHEDEQWPLPARPIVHVAQNSGFSHSLGQPQPVRQQRSDSSFNTSLPPRQARPPSPAMYGVLPQSSHHGTGQWTGNGYSAPVSRFAIQNVQYPPYLPTAPASTLGNGQPQYNSRYHRAPLGPPLTARKTSMDYPQQQNAQILSIAEEGDSVHDSMRNVRLPTTARSSYASSNAIPGYYTEEHEDNGTLNDPTSPITDAIDEVDGTEAQDPVATSDRYSDVYNPIEREGFDSSPEPTSLIRQASLGKKTRPVLTTVTRKDSVTREPPSSPPVQHTEFIVQEPEFTPNTSEMSESLRDVLDTEGLEDNVEGDSLHQHWPQPGQEVGGAAALAIALNAERAEAQARMSARTSRNNEIYSSGTGLAGTSPEEQPQRQVKNMPSRELLNAAVPKEQQNRTRPRSPLAPPIDPAVERIVNDLEKEGAITAEEAEHWKSPGVNVPEHIMRPQATATIGEPNRETDSRGSLTSLSDLIKRATKLANNLDRGRTASRLGMNFFETSDSESEGKRKSNMPMTENRRRSNVSFSDILSSFPQPADAARGGRWSSNQRHSTLPSDSDAGEAAAARRKQRKCCGMPRWLFALIILVIILLVAAAVLVPIFLVYLPEQRKSH